MLCVCIVRNGDGQHIITIHGLMGFWIYGTSCRDSSCILNLQLGIVFEFKELFVGSSIDCPGHLAVHPI